MLVMPVFLLGIAPPGFDLLPFPLSLDPLPPRKHGRREDTKSYGHYRCRVTVDLPFLFSLPLVTTSTRLKAGLILV